MVQGFVAQLEAELKKALKQLEAATEEREHAAQAETNLERDVRALKRLLARVRNDTDTSYNAADDPNFVSPYEEINRVGWALQQIAKAGAAGMLPTEIYETAKQQGIAMHPNYPYTVVQKLLERKQVVKVGKRYQAAETEAPKETP